MWEANADDRSLLGAYATGRSEEAFGILVRRHLALVYSAALRLLGGDAHRAEDVSQAVFIELSRQAPRLVRHPTLVGWLHTTTHHLACRVIRTEERRLRREQEAQAMHELEKDGSLDWACLRPVLDDALRELREVDRLAVLLRYFEGRDLRSIGQALGVSEDAARMRIDRALDRLRGVLAKRGLAASVATLTQTLGLHATETLPAGLAGTVLVSALAPTATTVSVAGTAGVFSQLTTPLTLMKTPLVATSLTAMVAAVPLFVQHQQLKETRAELEALRGSVAVIEGLRAEHGSLRSVAELARELEDLRGQESEWQRLREEADRLRGQAGPEVVRLQADLAGARSQLQAAEEAKAAAVAELEFRAVQTRTVNEMKHLGLGARIFSTDNQDILPTTFEEFEEVLGSNVKEVERYEFYPQPRIISEVEPQLFLFREKQPRQKPGGGWVRTYTLADGSVQILSSDTEDFTQAEKDAHGIASEEIPEAIRDHPAYRQSTP